MTVLPNLRLQLMSLNGKIPGLVSMEVGFNFTEGGYDAALYTVFADKESLDGYQTHPEHMAVKKFVHTVINERAVVDYEI